MFRINKKLSYEHHVNMNNVNGNTNIVNRNIDNNRTIAETELRYQNGIIGSAKFPNSNSNMNSNRHIGSTSTPSFVRYLTQRYPKNCSYNIYYGNCSNKRCKLIHSKETSDEFRNEMQRNTEFAKAEINQNKYTNFYPKYCIFNKYNCCFNDNCRLSHDIPEQPPTVNQAQEVAAPPAVNQAQEVAAPPAVIQAQVVAGPYLIAANVEPIHNTQQNGNQYNRSRHMNDTFVGNDFNFRTNICERVNCHCRQPHSINTQPHSKTAIIFDRHLSQGQKINLPELLLKLNQIYYSKFEIIIEFKNNRSEHFRYQVIPSPNGTLPISELAELFNFIENFSNDDINRIYGDRITQTEYSLIYEMFRRSKGCVTHTNYMLGNLRNTNGRSNFCKFGYNCRKGHHGINAVCFDDLFSGTCKCSTNPEEKINEITSEIECIKLEHNKDGFVTVMTSETKDKLKNLQAKISMFENQKKLHLHRDNHIDFNIRVVQQKLTASDFEFELPESSPFRCLSDLSVSHINYDLIRKERAELLNSICKEYLESITTPADYNTLVRGKIECLDEEGNPMFEEKVHYTGLYGLTKKNKLYKPAPAFIKNSEGNYSVPLCYINQTLSLNRENLTKDFSIEHKWSSDLWSEYMNETLNINGIEYPFWMDYTFFDYVSMKNTLLELYKHPMNTRKNWSVFINHYNNRISKWDEIFSADSFSADEDDIVMYSEQHMFVDYDRVALQSELLRNYLDHLAFILDINIKDDERVIGKMKPIHTMIMNEAPSVFNEFYEQFKVNQGLRFSSWIEVFYEKEFLIKKEMIHAEFSLIVDYLKKKVLSSVMDLETYITYPKIANEWIKDIFPKDDISFEVYLENRFDLYQYYSTNYYLTGKSIESMKEEIINGWKFNNTCKVPIFCSLLVLTLDQLKSHRQTIIKSFKSVLNNDHVPFAVNNLGMIQYSNFNKSVIEILAELVKPNCDLEKIEQLFESLEHKYNQTNNEIEFESYQFVQDMREWFLFQKRKQPKSKKIEQSNPRKLKKQQDDYSVDSSSDDDSDSDSDDLDDLLGKVPVRKSTIYDLGFDQITLAPSQKVFMCRNKKTADGAYSGNPILVGPITDKQFTKFKILTKKCGLPARLVVFNKEDKNNKVQVVSIPVRSNTKINSNFQAMIMEGFDVEDIEIKNLTTLDIDEAAQISSGFGKSSKGKNKRSIDTASY